MYIVLEIVKYIFIYIHALILGNSCSLHSHAMNLPMSQEPCREILEFAKAEWRDGAETDAGTQCPVLRDLHKASLKKSVTWDPNIDVYFGYAWLLDSSVGTVHIYPFTKQFGMNNCQNKGSAFTQNLWTKKPKQTWCIYLGPNMVFIIARFVSFQRIYIYDIFAGAMTKFLILDIIIWQPRKCSQEAAVEKVFRKYNLVYPAPITTECKQPLVDFPWIRPRDFLQTMFQYNDLHHILGGLSSMTEAAPVLRVFWERFKAVHPHFQLFLKLQEVQRNLKSVYPSTFTEMKG